MDAYVKAVAMPAVSAALTGTWVKFWNHVGWSSYPLLVRSASVLAFTFGSTRAAAYLVENAQGDQPYSFGAVATTLTAANAALATLETQLMRVAGAEHNVSSVVPLAVVAEAYLLGLAYYARRGKDIHAEAGRLLHSGWRKLRGHSLDDTVNLYTPPSTMD